MCDVPFKIRGRPAADDLVFSRKIVNRMSYEIFWSNLATKAGSVADWRNQYFDVCSQGCTAISMKGSLLAEVAEAERDLDKDVKERAYPGLPTRPWFIRAKSEVSRPTETCEGPAQSGVSTTDQQTGKKPQLPFGVFMFPPVRAVISELPPTFHDRPGISSLLRAEEPPASATGHAAQWTPDRAIILQYQADELLRVSQEVRVDRPDVHRC